MFFIYTLSLLVFVAAAIFAMPLRGKAWAALAFISLGALGTSVPAIGTLAGQLSDGWSHSTATPFGLEFLGMDALSAFFIIVIAIGGIASTLYSRGYLAHALGSKSPAHLSLHYTALTVMFYAMLGVVLARGGYTFLFFWELMTIASFLLILFDAERRDVRRAALSYLIMMHVGFVFLVVGFVRLRVATGSASFDALSQGLADPHALPLLLVFLIGFGMKAGLFPMHIWLPEAHPAAPSHVSALMSGVMIKTGVYGILRLAEALADSPLLHTAGFILLSAGIVTGLWSVILAASQNDVKRLLAYSSIENVGIIILGIGIALLGSASGNHLVALCGMTGSLLHLFNHSCFKSLLFFGAGNILTQTRTLSLDALGGLGRHMPLTAILFLIGTAAICALPPLSGFVSELLIYSGMFRGIASGSNPLTAAAGIVALALIGGIAILAFTKLYGSVFLGTPRTHEVAEASEVDNCRIIAMALPLAGILFVGLFPASATGLVTRIAGPLTATPTTAAGYLLSPALAGIGRTAWLLVGIVGLLAWLRHRILRSRTVTAGPTWGCGFTAPNTRMQYTGESFAEGLQSIVPSFTQQHGESDAVAKCEIFPSAHRFDISRKDRIDRLFSAWWVELLRQINRRVMRLRTGKINHYLLFALLFLTIVLLLSVLHLI